MSFKSGQIIKETEKLDEKNYNGCPHKNIVPLEIGFARKTWPNGYGSDPFYNFSTNLVGADTIRVKTYFCLDCKCELKAPSPGQCNKDTL